MTLMKKITGMMLIEMMSYVGDNLSYYIDTQFKETLFK